MSDEASLPQGQAADAQQQQHDWEKDYKELQATYTQSQQALKEAQGVWDDEDALLARIAEKHPHLIAEDDEDDDDSSSGRWRQGRDDQDGDFVPVDEPPHDPRLDEVLPRIDALTAAEAERAYNADLAGLVGERELPQKGQQFVRALCNQLGNDAKALETAVNEWFALFPEEKKERPKVPHTPGKGGAVTGGKPWSELTNEEFLERQLEMAAAMDSQT